MKNLEEIDRAFTYHAPHGDQVERYREIRESARRFAELVFAFCPESRERSLALTSTQQAVMWANAAIAIHEREEKGTNDGNTGNAG